MRSVCQVWCRCGTRAPLSLRGNLLPHRTPDGRRCRRVKRSAQEEETGSLLLLPRVLRFPASMEDSVEHSHAPSSLSYPYSERLPGNISKFAKPGLSLASCEDANDILPDEGALLATPEKLRDALEALLSRCSHTTGQGRTES